MIRVPKGEIVRNNDFHDLWKFSCHSYPNERNSINLCMHVLVISKILCDSNEDYNNKFRFIC